MKDSCLHCVLAKAAAEWLKTHNAPPEAITNMLGNFAAEFIAGQPSFQGLDIEVLILGTRFESNSERGRLH
jgi:hypothetical protein